MNILEKFFQNKTNFVNFIVANQFDLDDLNKVYAKEYVKLKQKLMNSQEFKSLDYSTLNKKQLKDPFSFFLARHVAEKKHDKNLFKETKSYLLNHIAQFGDGQCPYYLIQTDKTITMNAFSKAYIKRFPKGIVEWFENQNIIKTIIMDTSTSKRIVDDKFINIFKGFKFKPLPLNKYPKEVKAKGEWILNEYLKAFIADKNDEVFKFICCWIANLCNGKRNESMIVLEHVLKGIGKSTFIKFIFNLLGENACVKGSTKDILGNTNIHWYGKLFIYFEELSVSKSEYNKLSEALKDLITDSKMRLRGLFKDAIQVDATMSFVSCSNNLRVIKDNTGRRFLTCDLPYKGFIGNTKYFDKLHGLLEDEVVMSYLFNYFRSYKIDIDTRRVPLTEAKKNARILSYSPLHNFIRYKYLFKNKDIWCRKASLFKQYISYREDEDNNFTINSKQTFKKMFYSNLKNKLGIKPKLVSGNAVYHIKFDELETIAKHFKYDFRDETDDFFDSKKKQDLDDIATANWNETMSENRELKKENEDLKDKLIKMYELIKSSKGKKLSLLTELLKDSPLSKIVS